MSEITVTENCGRNGTWRATRRANGSVRLDEDRGGQWYFAANGRYDNGIVVEGDIPEAVIEALDAAIEYADEQAVTKDESTPECGCTRRGERPDERCNGQCADYTEPSYGKCSACGCDQPA